MIAPRFIPVLLAATGGLGLLAAFALMVERLRLLEDPAHVPLCSLNAVFSCGSVMTTSQASAFGVPNPLIGIVGFSTVLTIGMAMLAGARFRAWFWLGMQAGVTFAIVFVHWLMYQSIFRIEALCLYCMVVWVVTAILFWYVSLRNVSEHLTRMPDLIRVMSAVLQRNHTAILSLWMFLVAVVILQVFWL